MMKRVVAAVLCAVMALALLPAPAIALGDGNAAELQTAIDDSAGLLRLDRTYQGDGAAFSVSITSPLTLDLNGEKINDITLNIGGITAPAVTFRTPPLTVMAG